MRPSRLNRADCGLSTFPVAFLQSSSRRPSGASAPYTLFSTAPTSSGCLTFRLLSPCGTTAQQAPPSSSAHPTGDHTADRILEAINASSDGLLSRNQMNALFHGHLSSSRIEAALEQLISLGAIYKTSQPSGGRPSTLWSANAGADLELFWLRQIQCRQKQTFRPWF